ncbi:ketopantoate reductase family protein [Marinobacter bohaiensis]|uniref:ketopantoate reductase family protein n=1 Tax=Marinobacter bohaiensis TaxID=2201898 RepID=UPI000DAD4D8C|nr:2-dehydropantoate 2-reductase [Marinobacter bohaiensis]
MTESTVPPILIIGAGAMGRTWAAHLQPTRPVVFATRRSPGDTVSYLMTDTDGVQRHVSIPLWDHLQSLSAALVMTKAPDAEAAVERLQADLPAHLPLVLFQNGMGSQQTIRDRFGPHHPVLAASTTEGAYIASEGHLVHAGRGTTWLGGLNDSGRASVDTVRPLLTPCGLRLDVDPDIEARLWQKLAINAGINPFTALLDCPNGEILGTPYFEERIGAVCREVSALMQHEGRHASPTALEQQVRDVARRTAANSSSMRQDVRAGRSTEIDMMNGFVARASAAAGLAAPVNQALADAVKAL